MGNDTAPMKNRISSNTSYPIRHNWQFNEIVHLNELPFNDLLFTAHQIHRHFFDPNDIQISSLLSIKTGACPEDCAYCPQSIRHNTGMQSESLMDVPTVMDAAKKAQAVGATRFCMGAAWRRLRDKDIPQLAEMIQQVKSLGLEICVTLGMIEKHQAELLKQAGLDYYNHNIDTSESYY